MKNKMLFVALGIASVGVFIEPRLVIVGMLIALTGLFMDKKTY